jgi:hypothetical protein
MDKPLQAYGMYYDLKHLPIENEITEEQIPECTWYPASPTVICLWFTGMIVDPDFDWEHADWDKIYSGEITTTIPLSKEFEKSADVSSAEKDFLADGGTNYGESEFDMPDKRTLKAKEYRYRNTPYSCTKAEIIELAQKLIRFYNALSENNKRVFEAAKQEENYVPKIQMLFYSDNFDALEFYLDEETKEFKWRYYENGVTEIVEIPEKPCVPELPQISIVNKEIAELLDGVEVNSDSEFAVTADTESGKITVKGYTKSVPSALIKAYSGNSEVVNKLDELLKNETEQSLCLSGELSDFIKDDAFDSVVGTLSGGGQSLTFENGKLVHCSVQNAEGVCFSYLYDTIQFFRDPNGYMDWDGSPEIAWLGINRPYSSDEWCFPYTVKKVYELSFDYLKEVVLSEDCSFIRGGAFMGCKKLKRLTIRCADAELDGKIARKQVTIVAPEGSTAQAYAEKYGNKFEVLK